MCTSTSITLLVTTATVCASPLVEMAKLKRSELAKIALIAALVLIAPLLSTSMRPPFLYLLLNLLIIFLGAESGILKALISSPPDEKKPMAAAPVATAEASSGESGELSAVEKPVVEKNAAAVKAHKVKKCPSMPSLFFIGSNEVEDFEEDREEEDEEEDDIYEDEGQELFAKAEMFIGNFYKQLKIQREESWKKINGLYQRAF